jgi:hypothetical protein
MSTGPDFKNDDIIIYSELGLVKIGDGYVNFKYKTIVHYDSFYSSKNNYFYYHTNALAILYNNILYDYSAGILIADNGKVYDCETFKICCILLDSLYYVYQIDCVTQLNDKYTYMKINGYNAFVISNFTRSNTHRLRMKKYIAAGVINEYDIKYSNMIGCVDKCPRTLLGAGKKVNIFSSMIFTQINNEFNIKCPFEYNHDPAKCEIIGYNFKSETIYVALRGGKIRLVDGKIAGKSTKAAARD